MTEQTTRLKKFSRMTCFWIILLLWLQSSTAVASAAPKLPVLQQVGVIPVQWERDSNHTYALGQVRQLLQETFPEVVRNSRRFRVLNDDLVRGLWKNVDGREELHNQFELNAYVSLTVTTRNDTVNLLVRLMGPNLNSHLLEVDTVHSNWLMHADKEAINEKLEHLVFRLFNRIPVDVSVTSVQGSYITLSGGKEQGIEKDDKVKLVRSHIESLHPANGTWMTFNQFHLGVARIVEVKNYTSVAKLIKLTYESAVEVGDGAHIGAIAGRVKFARLAKKNSFRDSGKQKTIIVPPLYSDAQAKSPSAQRQRGTQNQDQKVAPAQGALEAKPSTDGSSGEAKAATPQQPIKVHPEEDNSDGILDWGEFDFGGIVEKVVDDITIHAGAHVWNIGGPISSAGKFPIWLINNIGATVTRTIFYKIHVGFGGAAGFGMTDKGSYFLYNGHGRIYWQDSLNLGGGLLRNWKAGGHGSLSGMSVAKEKYGGGDWGRFAGFGGIDGSLYLGPMQNRYDWFSELAITTLNVGRVGYNGRHRFIESTRGWKLTLGAFKYMPAGMLQFGGAFVMTDEKMTLNNGARVHMSDYNLLFLTKYAF